MGMFDELESRCTEIAGKVGIPPETVQSMGASLQGKLNQEGMGKVEALEAVASEHGVPVDKVQEVLSHCGSEQDIVSGLTGLGAGLFKG
jgi:hypothetical protein